MGSIHWGYYVELICLEGSCLILWIACIAQFLSYRFSPPSRCNPITLRLLQLASFALILQTIRLVDVSVVFGRLSWTLEAVMSDQVSAVIVFATVQILLVSTRTLYSLLMKPFPKSMPYMMWTTVILYELGSTISSTLLIVLLPQGPSRSNSTEQSKLLMGLHGMRIVNFGVMCLSISIASWITLFGLRGKVEKFAHMLEEQEQNRAKAANRKMTTPLTSTRLMVDGTGATFGATAATYASDVIAARSTIDATSPPPPLVAPPVVALSAAPTAVSTPATPIPRAVDVTTLRVAPAHQQHQQQQQQTHHLSPTIPQHHHVIIGEHSPKIPSHAAMDQNTRPPLGLWRESPQHQHHQQQQQQHQQHHQHLHSTSSVRSPSPSSIPVAGTSYLHSPLHGLHSHGPSPLCILSMRLSTLHSAARKLHRLFLAINFITWMGLLTNVRFLVVWATGSLFQDVTLPREGEVTMKPLQPMYAIGQQIALMTIIWYSWMKTEVWRKRIGGKRVINAVTKKMAQGKNGQVAPTPESSSMTPTPHNGFAWATSSRQGDSHPHHSHHHAPKLTFWQTLLHGAPEILGGQYLHALQQGQMQPYPYHPHHPLQHVVVQQPPPPVSSPPHPPPSPLTAAATAATSPHVNGLAAATIMPHPSLTTSTTNPDERGATIELAVSQQHQHQPDQQQQKQQQPMVRFFMPNDLSVGPDTGVALVPIDPSHSNLNQPMITDFDIDTPPVDLAVGQGSLIHPPPPPPHPPTLSSFTNTFAHDGEGAGGGDGVDRTTMYHVYGYGGQHHHHHHHHHHGRMSGGGGGFAPLDSHASHAPTGLSMRSGLTSFQAQRRPGDFAFGADGADVDDLLDPDGFEAPERSGTVGD